MPFVLTLQEGDPIDYIKRRVGLLYPLLKLIFKKADRITAISNYLATWAKEMGAISPVAVVPNGVDLGRFTNYDSLLRKIAPEGQARFMNGERGEMRKKWGFGETDTVLVTTSRLVKKNGVGDVISALRLLPETVKFVIVGVGELEKKLKDDVARFGLTGRVVFAGFVAHEVLPEYLV